ncbi:tRNA (adenine(58)-N(1))-methyltransferase non-catalytic subunit TRM6 isoform X2 [Lingula anatina]|nr:tRNA (adenine(58)-N(1))-methyltransferase non-catalytic subunit TRM6 isoform X2 [Lingula anatina]|eukprot:XP_013409113.1 tRNA (adenine(58)-N(1))-methyltransferase non-catalytic subunit TRM6 isoform X2 [Lingula anatina]
MEKIKFTLNGLIGQPYGTTFEVKNGQMVRLSRKSSEEEKDADGTSGIDNRNLNDCRSNQKLSREEIYKMKKEGVSGESIVETLVENSSTFRTKTEFAQEKYIKKKKKKHLNVFTVLKPTTRLLCEMHYNKGPSKICNLRVDSLSQMLVYGNVRAHSKLMVVETCGGLVLGAVMEKMGGYGTVVQLYTGTAPVRQTLEAYNFPQHFYDSLHAFPLNKVNCLEEGEIIRQHNKNISEVQVKTEPLLLGNYGGKTSEQNIEDISDVPKEGVSEFELKKEETEEDTVTENENGLSSDRDVSKESETQNEENQEGKGAISCQQIAKRKLEEERNAKRQLKQQHLEKSRQILLERNMDGLLVACKLNPTPIVMSLMEYVAPSRPIVVYCQYQEPLMECFVKLRQRGGVVHLTLTETWLREYQVLPGRTRPNINMSGTGGYLLTGTTVIV